MYTEEQQYRQGWVWGLLIATCLLMTGMFGYGMVQQLVLGKPWGDRPMSDTALIITGSSTILFVVLIAWMFLVLKMITEVREDGVYIAFVPITTRRVGFEEIETCEARTYRPIREFGGWGIKFGRGGRAFNVSGNRGVQLKLIDGTRFLIGSQRPEPLAAAINERLHTR